MATINDAIPYELLCKIFLYCLPSNPLKQNQPDLANAPMLLCHVCSYWRAVAISYPKIWTHLYYVTSLMEPMGAFRTDDISFLRWWLGNIGPLSPSLRLEFKEDARRIESGSEQLDVGVSANFMINIITSARYLNLDSHYSSLLQHLLGGKSLTLPGLDTLVMRCDGRKGHQHFRYTDIRNSEERIDNRISIPTSTVRHKRRLFFQDMPIITIKPVMVWSNITHMHAHFATAPQDWFSLLRTCDSLETGSFHILMSGAAYTPVTSKTLPQLRKLSLSFLRKHEFTDLLHGIHLPSLIALRLATSPNIDITGLHGVLSSTPALKELQLGDIYPTMLADFTLIPGDMDLIGTSLQSVVPALESIHFAGHHWNSRPKFQEHRDGITAVLTGPWLQLARPAARLTCVEFNVMGWNNGRYELELVLQNLNLLMGEGVRLVVRAEDANNLGRLLEIWSMDYPDDFDDLGFRENI